MRQLAASAVRPLQCQPPIVPAKPLSAAVAAGPIGPRRFGSQGGSHCQFASAALRALEVASVVQAVVEAPGKRSRAEVVYGCDQESCMVLSRMGATGGCK
jgi:hypothetical protein